MPSKEDAFLEELKELLKKHEATIGPDHTGCYCIVEIREDYVNSVGIKNELSEKTLDEYLAP